VPPAAKTTMRFTKPISHLEKLRVIEDKIRCDLSESNVKREHMDLLSTSLRKLSKDSHYSSKRSGNLAGRKTSTRYCQHSDTPERQPLSQGDTRFGFARNKALSRNETRKEGLIAVRGQLSSAQHVSREQLNCGAMQRSQEMSNDVSRDKQSWSEMTLS